MSDGLATVLNAEAVDSAQLQHAVRYLVAEWSEDAFPEEMRDRLISSGIDLEQLDEMVAQLESDPALIEAASLYVLNSAWADSDLQPSVTGALEDAKTKLPVVEVTLIAIAVMYGLWLARTGGRRRQVRVITRHADGTYEERDEIEWYGPSGPLQALASLVAPAPLVERGHTGEEDEPSSSDGQEIH